MVTAARSAARLVPDRWLVRLLPRRIRWDPAAMHVAVAPDSPVRLYVGPVNSAGQGYQWARAAERNLQGVGAIDLMTTDAATARYGFPADVSIPVTGFALAGQWQQRQRRALVEGFTHVLLESGRFAYGSVPGSSPRRIADELSEAGLAVALVWHGSDIRIPSRHAQSEPDSPFGPGGDYPQKSTDILERNARERMQLVEETAYPVFVSTPGLLGVPRAQWLPVVVEMARWKSSTPLLDRSVPIVAYVPSNSPMKGDASIDTQLARLDADGLISYRRLQDIPSSEMPAVYGAADIVLDQFRLGDYGVTACEAMAAGRIVIGHVSDDVRERVRVRTGLELPIVESRIAAVSETVRTIVENPGLWRDRGAAGVAFTEAVHNGRASALALADFLGAPSRPGPPSPSKGHH
jgi:hypothetical protein